MPDTAIAEAPATPVTTTETAAPDSGDNNLESFLSTFDAQPKEAPAPKEKSATEKAKPDESKAKEKASEKLVEDKLKAESVEKAPPQKLYVAHEALKKSHKELERQHETAQARIKEFESKKPDAADSKVVEELMARNKQLEGELRESAYERSPDFKREFLDRRQAAYAEAVSEIGNLAVRMPGPVDEFGKPTYTERAATEQDFRDILEMRNPKAQDAAIDELFGRSAGRVHSHLREMKQIERDARLAIQRERDSSEGKLKERSEKERQQGEQKAKVLESAKKAIAEKWPDIFGEPEDPTEKEMVSHGISTVKEAMNGSNLSTQQQAELAAVFQSWAERFPLVWHREKTLRAENKMLREKLGVKEGADPGAGRGESKEVEAANDGVPSIDEFANTFTKE